MHKKLKKLVIVITSCLVTSNLLLGSTVTGIHSINNSTKESDYKLKEEQLKAIGSKLNNTTDIKEYFSYTDEKDTSGFEKEIAFLLENNIVTREGTITVKNDKVELSKGQIDLGSKITLSEFLMGLHKSKWGIIESNPLIIKTASVRNIDGEDVTLVHSDEYIPQGYDGVETSFDFDGDYHVYVSPNVAELYIASLLNKGIVSRTALQGTIFLREFDSLSVNPPKWGNSNYLEISTGSNTPLGSSWQVNESGNKKTFVKGQPKIFLTETVTKMEALTYVADVLRLTEREMTETEAKIVSYKYGVNYLNNLSPNDRKTIEYLIAMGIINFEDQSSLGNLYDPLNFADAFDIFYRVANVSGRYDFSKIQLTDSDDFWIQNGYGQSTLNLITLKKDFSDILDTVVERITDIGQINPTLKAVEEYYKPKIGFELVDNETTTDGKPSWKITRYFPKNTYYTYRGVEISKLDKKVDDVVSNTYNKEREEYVVEFAVQASDSKTAVMIIDSHTQHKTGSIANQKELQTVTKINPGTGDEITLVSSKALSDISSDLQILEDKVLMNKVSGAMAVLLPDNGYALVGTEIIVSDDLLVFTTGGEVYYNLEVISSLLTNAFISKLDNNSLYLTKTSNGWFKDSDFVNVYSSNSSAIDTTNISKVSGVPGPSGTTQSLEYYNVSLMQRGINTIYRDIGDCTIVVDWSYIVPNEFAGNFADYNYNPSIRDMTEFFYTKPAAPLAEWWESNIELGNSIANWMYNTKGIEYIKCGYLSPTINILAPTVEMGEKLRDEMLQGLGLSQSYLIKHTGVSDISKLLGSEFNYKPVNGDNTYNTLKASRKLFINPKVSVSSKELGNGDCYTNFLKLANGAIYRSISSDSRILKGSKSGDTVLFVKTRTADTSSNILAKTLKFKGKEFYVRGIGGGTKDSNDQYPENMYYKLMSTTPISGNIVKAGTNKYVLKDKAILKEATNLSSLGSVSDGTVWLPNDELLLHDAIEGPHLKRNGYYLINGEIYFLQAKGASLGNYIKVSDKEIKEEIINKNAVVYTYPVLWVNRNSVVYDEETGALEEATNIPYLTSANVFYSGLNRAVIDSIIANSSNVKPVNKLNDGDTLMVGDIEFIRENGMFKSRPATDRAVIDSVLAGNNTEESAAKAFTGIALDYSGRNVPLIDYVEFIDVGELPKKVDGASTIVKIGGQLLMQDGGGRTDVASGAAKSIALNAKFNNNVLCRSIGGNKYVMVHSTSSLSEGYLSNAPFFGEQLDFGVSDDLLAGIEKGTFSPLGNYIDKMEEFKEQILDFRRQDIQTVIRNILVIVCWGFILISWIAYAVLRFGLGNVLLESLRNPSRGSNRMGLDLLKIISFGVYDLDMQYSPSNPNSIKFSSILVGSIFAMLIQYILITFF